MSGEGRLAGQVAIITGASRGIGKALAQACRREGMKLALSARGAGPLEALALELDPDGAEVLAVAGDVSDRQLCQRLVQKNDGELRIHYLPDGGCKVQIRFPAAMLAARQPARTPCADRGQGSEIA